MFADLGVSLFREDDLDLTFNLLLLTEPHGADGPATVPVVIGLLQVWYHSNILLHRFPVGACCTVFQ